LPGNVKGGRQRRLGEGRPVQGNHDSLHHMPLQS
jgi:hypothetical protein